MTLESVRIGLLLALALMGAAAAPAPVRIAIDGMPTGVAVAHDGTLYVSADGRFGVGGSVVAFVRDGGVYRREGTVAVESGAQDVAVTPDGSIVVATTRVGLVAIDVRAFGVAPDKVGGYEDVVRDGDAPRTNRIVIDATGTSAYYTNQAAATLGVARLERNAGGKPRLRIVSHAALDRLPGGLALSPDGETVYVTSEIDNADPKRVNGAADSRLGRERCASNLGPHGVLSAVDVRRAADDSEHAVIARVAAGCAPVRVALSAAGDVAWVTSRGDDRILAFDTSVLRRPGVEAGDASAHVLLADVSVGATPVGVALSADGRELAVANSHRSPDRDDVAAADISIVDPVAALAGKTKVEQTIPACALAREVVAASDGAFFVTCYRDRTVELVTPSNVRP